MAEITAEEFFREWVADLESEQYPQVKGALAKSVVAGNTDAPMGFCCLGVACEVAYRHGLLKRTTIIARDDHGEVIVKRLYDGGGSVLPAVLQELLSVGASPNVSVPAKYRLPGSTYDLTELNDIKHLSFAQIAAIIAWNFLNERPKGTQDASA